MSVCKIVVGSDGRRIRKLKRSSTVVAPSPKPAYDDDYVDPAAEEKYEREVEESDGFDVSHCPLIDDGISPYSFKDKYDYPYDIGLLGRLGLHCYNFQEGTNLKLTAINKDNSEYLFTVPREYLTLEAIDTSSNFPYNFQTCVGTYYIPEEASFMVRTELARLKVPPTGRARDTPIWREMLWNDKAVDDFYKGKMPSWLTKDELDAANEKGQFYELQESDLQENDWIHLYAEFAFYSKWIGFAHLLKPFLPLEMKKVIIQTEESGEELPSSMKLKAKNAIFYMSFKGNGGGDPRGLPTEYQAFVRRTMDGMPGHISLEVDCIAYKPN